MSPVLAPEVLDQIFQYLSDFHDLYAGALTCRAWHEPANRALYLLDARLYRRLIGYATHSQRPESVARLYSYPEYFTNMHELSTAIIVSRNTDRDKLIDVMLRSATFIKVWLASGGRDQSNRSPFILAIEHQADDLALRLMKMEAEHGVQWDYSDHAPLVAACGMPTYGGQEAKHRIVNALLEAGHDVNTPARSPPLYAAVQSEDDYVARLLLERGANVNVRLEKGYTPLSLAVKQGSTRMVQLLVAHGADWHFQTDSGSTALHVVSHANVAELALQAGVPIEGTGSRRAIATAHPSRRVVEITPLMRACERGLPLLATYLIEQGARVDVVNKGGFNVLHAAACRGMVDVVKAAHARGVDVNAIDWKSWQTPLHYAASKGDVTMVETLLRLGADTEQEDKDGKTPMYLAHTADVMRVLVEHGAHIDGRGSRHTPLQVAANTKNETKFWQKRMKGLIQYGASLTAMDALGYTPLQLAVSRGIVGSVRTLVEAGADVEMRDHNGQSPLMHACNYGYVEIARILLDAGADVSVKGVNWWYDKDVPKDSISAMLLASSRYGWNRSDFELDRQVTLIRMLLEAGADIRCGERFFNDRIREELKETLYSLDISLAGYTITKKENGKLVIRPNAFKEEAEADA